MKILFFGDIVGKPGRKAVATILPQLRKEHNPDLVIANAENLAHGKGVTLSTLKEMDAAGIDFFTSGNHIYDKPEGIAVFAEYPDRLIRPDNFVLEKSLPGKGYQIWKRGKHSALIINLSGQVFMEKQFDQGVISNPYEKLNEILSQPDLPRVKFLDFHAEATSEKRAMGFWSDGRVSAVVGTHTHVPTADAQILPLGTGYITDAGMSGAAQSVIGMDQERAIARLLAGESRKLPLEVADTGQFECSYVVFEIDEATGKCQNINSFVKII